MTASEILYGVRDSQLIHIDDVARGLACGCCCPECGRPLVAKKGEVLMHHFAHAADDPNCNPTPESLVHRYAKQQLAKLSQLVLPGFRINAQHVTNDDHVHHLSWRHHPFFKLHVVSAQVEAEVDGYEDTKVIPDVLFETEWGRVALEVYFRHQVPAEKIWKFSHRVHISALEVCMNDLPVESSSASINAALADVNRWRWLHNQHSRYMDVQMVRLLALSSKIFVPQPSLTLPKLTMRTVPSTKLKQAANMGGKVRAFLQRLGSCEPFERIQLVRGLDTTTRIALHCHYLQLSPLRLPLHLMQTVENGGALGTHPVVWQTGVFAKFCISGGDFSAQEVESWVRNTIEDKAFLTPESITQTTNGFSPVAEGVYHFLRNIAAQGLLAEIRGQRPWSSRFAPVAPNKEEVRLLLMAQIPAVNRETG
jgi:Competence protein CoiA-like family